MKALTIEYILKIIFDHKDFLFYDRDLITWWLIEWGIMWLFEKLFVKTHTHTHGEKVIFGKESLPCESQNPELGGKNM